MYRKVTCPKLQNKGLAAQYRRTAKSRDALSSVLPLCHIPHVAVMSTIRKMKNEIQKNESRITKIFYITH